MSSYRKLTQTAEAFFRIKRGLSAYISYLSACGMTTVFSEYLLYEPIVRILRSRGFAVQCEYVCPGIPQPASGDKKKLDFLATRNELQFAIEVKWIRSKTPSLDSDINKLVAFVHSEKDKNKASRAFLCLFGKKSDLSVIQFHLPPWAKARNYGSPVYADLRRTRYGCKVYEITPNI